jgi:hypothetical protein
MSILLSFTALAVLAPPQVAPQKTGEQAFSQLPQIQGIPKAAKFVELKGIELDAAKSRSIVLQALAPSVALTVDLRAEAKTRAGAPRDQGDRPTGSIHAMTFLAEFVASKKMGINNLNLSEEYMNRIANQVCGNAQDGEFLTNCFRAYMTAGVCKESMAPYHPVYNPGYPAISGAMVASGQGYKKGIPLQLKPWLAFTVPPQNLPGQPAWPTIQGHGFSEAHLGQMKALIAQRWPVAVSIRWPNDYQTVLMHGVGLLKMLPIQLTLYSKGVVLIGFRQDARFPGGGFFAFRNSDGPYWGDQGNGYVSFNYVRNLGLAGYALR